MIKVSLNILIFAFSLLAWDKDGSPIATGPGDQTEPRVIAPEGKDYFYVVWSEVPGDYRRVVAGKFDVATGEPLWSSPFIVADTGRNQWDHQIVATPSGNLIITFQANFASEGGEYTVYATKIGHEKTWEWSSKWIKLSSVEAKGKTPQLCLDGSGEGCYVTWTDYRSGNQDVWIARVTGEGQVAWGVPVCSLANDQGTSIAVKSGDGCIIFWGDGRDNIKGIYGQRFTPDSPSGQWGANGKLIIPFNLSEKLTFLENNPYFFSYAIEDGRGGSILHDYSGITHFWQRVDSLGNLYWNPPPEIVVHYHVVSNGITGAIGCEGGGRGFWYPHSFVSAIQIDSLGKSVWGEVLKVWEGPEDTTLYNTYPTLTDDSRHGAVITWVQSDWTGNNLLISRVDSSGKVIWSPPTIICNLPSEKAHPFVIKGPNQDYIVVWEDARNDNFDLYAQYVDSTGQVGMKETAEKEPFSNEGLISNEPNPFSQTIKIKYKIASPNLAELAVFDVTGRRVKELVKDKVNAGIHTTMWDGRDWSGKKVPSGFYFCLLQISREKEKVISAKKIVLIGKEDQ